MGMQIKKISAQEMSEVLMAATPAQLAELREISKTFDVPMHKVCAELLTLINARFPMPKFVFSRN